MLMVDALLLGLQVVAAGWALLLAALALTSAVRYRETRFGYIAAGLFVLALVPFTGAFSTLGGSGGFGSSLGYAPTAMIVAVDLLLFLALTVERPPGGPAANA
jgi:hypothetical protein